MIGNIRDAFTAMLDESTWMDDKSKRLAKEKVSSIRISILHPFSSRLWLSTKKSAIPNIWAVIM